MSGARRAHPRRYLAGISSADVLLAISGWHSRTPSRRRSAVREAFRVLTDHSLNALDPARSTSVAFAAVELRAAMKGSRVSYRAAARRSMQRTRYVTRIIQATDASRRVVWSCLITPERGLSMGLLAGFFRCLDSNDALQSIHRRILRRDLSRHQ